MSTLDEKYINNLQNFSDSLENLVEILKEQHKQGGQAGSTDTVNTMLGNMDTEKITKIVEDLEEIKNTSMRIENNTEKILTEVKDARKAKEAGMFNNIENPENKNKIVDGIKVVTLIAGGILAVGMAFKIIGKVDFLSVIGLSVALLIMSKTYSEMSQMKGMNWKNILVMNAILITMSISILAASKILESMPDLAPMQLLTAVAVGLTMGLVSWGLMKGLNSFDPKNIWMVAVIPILIPAIAMGVAGAAKAFETMKPMSIGQLITAVFVGVALIPISFAFSLMAKGLKGADWKSILFTALAVPILAATIVGASYLFQSLQPINDVVGLVLTSLAIGISVLAIVPAFYLLSKLKLDIESLFMGALAIIVISSTIMVASHILSVGNYSKYPSVDWAAGVGLSLLSFVPSVVILGLIATSGVGLVAIGFGLLSVIGVALSMVAVSHLLSLGNWEKYPSVKWAAGVGLSLLTFIVPMIALGTLIMATLGIGGLLLLAGAGAIMGIVGMMVNISRVFSSNTFEKYPAINWVQGVNAAIVSFGSIMTDIMKLGAFSLIGGSFIVMGLISMMLSINDLFSKTNFENFPSINWVNGVGGSLTMFGKYISTMPAGILDMLKVSLLAREIVNMAKLFNEHAELFNNPNVVWIDNIRTLIDIFQNLPDKNKADGLNAITTNLNKMALLGVVNIMPILFLAGAIKNLSSALDDLNSKNVDKLNQLSKGVMILSIIDETKLNDVIETLNDKRKELYTVFDEQGSSLIQDILNAKSGGVSTSPVGGTTVNTTQTTISEKNESVTILKEISEKMDAWMAKMEKVEKASNVSTSLGI
jgi:hypothetical protein